MPIFFAALLIVAAAGAAAQPLFITETSGAVARANGKPVALLEPLKAGELITLPSGARAVFFVPAQASTYSVEGPAEVVTTASGLTAARGSLPQPRRVDDAYRNLKVRAGDAAQGSLVMRGYATAAYLVGPQGPVDAGEARKFRWSEGGGPWQFELATEAGALVHRAQVSGAGIVLPDSIALAPGVKYVWGITPVKSTSPVDWTEFTLAPAGQAIAPVPPGDASRSERLLYALWLRSQRMPRAASRVLAQSTPP
jgi:hypothetical protein